MDAILYPILEGEREVVRAKWKNDPLMLETLEHAYNTQDSLDADIRSFSVASTGKVSVVMDWLIRQGSKDPTPYDYRRHARAIAAALLFKITDGVPSAMARRIVNEDKWSREDQTNYWRCVAICSAAWVEEAGQ